ncbi:MAG: ribbon-helix-helix domain-containing protein [Patescibacteria group bacterium]
MDTMTINISMPKGLYAQAKIRAKKYHYTSVSEVIRDALRWWLNDNLTRNGFTPEFEEETLKAAKEADAGNVIEWDGKGSFVDFVLREGKKKYDKNQSHRKILPKPKRTPTRITRIEGGDRTASAMV